MRHGFQVLDIAQMFTSSRLLPYTCTIQTELLRPSHRRLHWQPNIAADLEPVLQIIQLMYLIQRQIPTHRARSSSRFALY